MDESRTDIFQMVDEFEWSTPEKALWCAVIGQSYTDITYYLDPTTKTTQEAYLTAKRAKTWIESNSSLAYSFLWCVTVVFGSYENKLEEMVIARLRDEAKKLIIKRPKL